MIICSKDIDFQGNKWVALTAVIVDRLPEELNAEKFDSKLDEGEDAEDCLMGLVKRECRDEDEVENRSELQRNMSERTNEWS